jgi:Tfp pilus assembly protein PilV
MRQLHRNGFTLIEALGAAVILGIGIVTAISAFSAMARSEAKSREMETMHRLAVTKYDELIVTTTPPFSNSDSGDFTDRNDTTHVWNLTVTPTGTTNLDALTVQVSRNDSNNGPYAEVDGLFNEPPTTSTTGVSGG